MSASLDANAEKRFLTLKRRLDSLHICQPFTIDSAALVERLLSDLVKTTEGFQNIKKQNTEAQKNVLAAEQALEPLKRENAKLIKENNELHYAMIKIKEDAEFANNKWKTTLSSLEGERNDLKFVLQQKETRIRRAEDENLALKSKLDTFMSKVYIPSTQGGLDNLPAAYNLANTSAPTNISLSKKGQQFEINKPLNNADIAEYQGQRNDDLKSWAEQVRAQDTRIEELTRELRGFEENKVLLLEKSKHLEVQIQNREAEIKRLHQKIDLGNVNVTKLSTEYELDQQGEKIERLNHQIDFLSKENHSLETELSGLKTDLKRINLIKEESRQQAERVQELTRKLEEAQMLIRSHEQKRQNIREQFESQIEQEQEKYQALIYQKEKLAQQIQTLGDNINELTEENKQLQLQANKADQVVQAYQSDKRVFSQAVEKVRAEKEGAVEKMENFVSELNAKQLQIQEVEEARTMLNNRIVSLQRELSLSSSNQDRLQSENRQLSEELSRVRETVNELQNEIVELSDKRQEAKLECDRVARQKEQVTELAEKAKGETYKLKSDVETNNLIKEKLERQIDSLSKENQLLKRDITHLEEIVGQNKRSLLQEEEKSRDQYQQIRVLNEQIRELGEQILEGEERFSEKAKELRESENARSESQRELLQYTSLKRKLEAATEKSEQLSEQLKEAEEKRLKSQKECDSMRYDLMDKNESLKKAEDLCKAEREERARLAQELAEKSQESRHAKEQVKLSKEKESEQSVLEVELEKARDRERKQIMEVLSLQGDLKKAENLIIQGTKQVEYLNNQKEEYIRELKELRKELLSTKTDRDNTTHDVIAMKEKIKSYELESREANEQINKQERKYNNLDNEFKIQAGQNRELESELSQKNSEIKQLQLICDGLERVREELLERLQNKNSERLTEEGQVAQLNKEITQLNKQLNDVQGQLKQAKDSLVRIDEERDEVQNLLDSKTQENLSLLEQLEQLQSECDRIKDTRNQLSSKTDQSVSRVISLETQLKDAQKKIQQLLADSENLNYAISLKDKELMDLSNDLNVVTRQNQTLSDQLVGTAADRDQIKGALNASMLEEKKQKQALRAQELEKQDLLGQYKIVCLDNEKLERHAQDLVGENQSLFHKAQDFEKELSLLQGHLQHLEAKEQQMLNDLQNYERQITFLNSKLESADQHIKDINAQKDSMHREYESMIRVSQGLEGNRDDMQRSLMQFENEKIQLIETLNLAKREIDAKTSQLEYERSRAAQLEEVLIRERQVQHNQKIENQAAQQENEHILRQIDDLKAQNMSLQTLVQQSHERNGYQSADKDSKTIALLEQKIDEKNLQIRTLESDQRKYREENSKLRLNMYRFETEKNDLEKRINSLRESQASGGDNNDSDVQLNQEGWERLQAESQNFKRSLNEASIKSQALNQNVKNLKREYDQELTPSSTKSKRSNK